MKKLLSIFLSFIMIAALGVSAFAIDGEQGLVIYASPTGALKASGTLNEPLSLLGAKEKLKSLKNKNSKATVYLLGGTYCFSETLSFDNTDMPNVTYKAYNNESVIFSGAKAITGFTEKEVNGVKVFSKMLDTTEENWYFKSLFSDKNSLRVTRYPEEGYLTVKSIAPEDDLWTEENTPWEYTRGQRAFYANTNDIPKNLHNVEDVQIRILHYWHDELMNIKSFDEQSGKIGLSRPSTMLIRDIDRYYFENVFEALNEPGEWYLDSKTGELFYVPFENEKPENTTLYSSNTPQLVTISGVDGISFEGINFTRTDWEFPEADGMYLNSVWDENDMDFAQAAILVDGVVAVEYAKNIHIKNCEFTDLGGTAIKYLNGVKNSSIENCYFENIAATGIFVGGQNCLPNEPGYTENIVIKNNEIYKYGRKFYCAIGIQVTFCNNMEIANNEIHDGYYTGISVGWIWGYAYNATDNIKINRNLIYNIGQGWLSDMGGIYMLGKQPKTVISENVIHNVAADAGEGGYGGWGIYLDEGSSYMRVEKNLIYACRSEGINIHYGEGNCINNNICAFNAEGQVSAGNDKGEAHATATFSNNIFVTKNKAPIYVNMVSPSHFYDNGNLMWSYTDDKTLFFDVFDSYEDIYTLDSAKKEGFIHNEAVADPLFKDALNFDFTLSEESPALALYFEPWDYSVAGTLKNSTIGIAREGGLTKYNDNAKLQDSMGFDHSVIIQYMDLIFAILIAIPTILGLAIFVIKTKKMIGIPALSLVLTLPCFIGIYNTYLEWIEIPYYILCLVLGGLITTLPVCTSIIKGKSKKNKIITGVISFVLLGGGFLGIAGIFNLLIGPDTPQVIISTTAVMLLVVVILTVRLLKSFKNKAV